MAQAVLVTHFMQSFQQTFIQCLCVPGSQLGIRNANIGLSWYCPVVESLPANAKDIGSILGL